MPKPTRDEAIAFALDRFRGHCQDYPGGLTGLLADIACLSRQRISNLASQSRKKTVSPERRTVSENT